MTRIDIAWQPSGCWVWGLFWETFYPFSATLFGRNWKYMDLMQTVRVRRPRHLFLQNAFLLLLLTPTKVTCRSTCSGQKLLDGPVLDIEWFVESFLGALFFTLFLQDIFLWQNAILPLTKVTCRSTWSGRKVLDAGPGRPGGEVGREARGGAQVKIREMPTFISPCSPPCLFSFLQVCWSCGMHSRLFSPRKNILNWKLPSSQLLHFLYWNLFG